jgi:3-oxoacyl-[acyl-carrier-protein] synthase-3
MPQPFQSRAVITAIGSYVPEEIMTNEDLSRLVDTSDEWIVRRTGIRTRHRAAAHEFSSHMAIAAIRNMAERFRIDPGDADAILVATTTPDMPFPSTAALIQKSFGMPGALTADLNAACAGFVTALQMANGLILSGAYRKIIVVGTDTMTKITDYTDRSTCILFGDGAGAVMVEAATEGAFLSSFATTDGNGGHLVYLNGLSRMREGLSLPEIGNRDKLVQNGREVYKWAVSTIPGAIGNWLAQSGHCIDELDWFVPHSANLRMIEAICERLGIPSTRALESVTACGNTSSASIPLALDMGLRNGRLRPGNLVLLFGFGAGLAQSGLLMRWTAEAQ